MNYHREMKKPAPKPSDYSPNDIEWEGASTLLPQYHDRPHGLDEDGWHFEGGSFWRVKPSVANAS